MGEGTRGKGIENNHLQSTPWDFWNSVQQQPAFLISWQNVKVNLCTDVRFSSGYKIQRNTIGRIAAFSIWLDLCLLKKIFITSILHMKKFCRSKTLKDNFSKQACCFWIKKISERWENNSSQKSRCKWDLCLLNKIFIARIFRCQKVLRFWNYKEFKKTSSSKQACCFCTRNILGKEKKHLAHFFGKINWSHQSLCMWTFSFNLSYGVSGINTHYSNKTSIKKIQSFDLKVELWVQ